MEVPSIEVELVAENRKPSLLWYQFLRLLGGGYTGTITTAALTGGGTQGSMTFRNGILISQTPAT